MSSTGFESRGCFGCAERWGASCLDYQKASNRQRRFTNDFRRVDRRKRFFSSAQRRIVQKEFCTFLGRGRRRPYPRRRRRSLRNGALRRVEKSRQRGEKGGGFVMVREVQSVKLHLVFFPHSDPPPGSEASIRKDPPVHKLQTKTPSVASEGVWFGECRESVGAVAAVGVLDRLARRFRQNRLARCGRVDAVETDQFSIRMI